MWHSRQNKALKQFKPQLPRHNKEISVAVAKSKLEHLPKLEAAKLWQFATTSTYVMR